MFWKNKKVLVTGHTGFKGAWLCFWLHQQGAQVFGVALPPPTNPSLYELLKIPDTIQRSIFLDIGDVEPTVSAIGEIQPDVLFHLAAQSLVRPSYADPVNTFRTNVLGTAHVLEGVRQCPNVKATIVVTSDKCYENHEYGRPFKEGDPMGGSDPYSASKGCTELVTASFQRSFPEQLRGRGIASVRAGNVIGGGDWSHDRLVPDIVKAFQSGSTLYIRNPGAVRPWQHVFEPLAGYLTLAELLFHNPNEYNRAWNFGPTDESHKDVAWMVNGFKQALGEGFVWSTTENTGPHESTLLSLDSSLAREKIGWRPRLSISEAVSWTVDWYTAYLSSPSSITDISRQQLDRYTSLA